MSTKENAELRGSVELRAFDEADRYVMDINRARVSKGGHYLDLQDQKMINDAFRRGFIAGVKRHAEAVSQI